MEGVGARLGRSSTRYGPATTVFNGPVRKWKKRWVSNHHYSSVNNASSLNSSTAVSHLLFYKWTPKDPDSNDPPKRKFKYIPIYELEKQKNEIAEREAAENGDFDEKPDINDVPMEESQSRDENRVVHQDLNESTLDLSLGFASHDGDTENKRDHARDGKSE